MIKDIQLTDPSVQRNIFSYTTRDTKLTFNNARNQNGHQFGAVTVKTRKRETDAERIRGKKNVKPQLTKADLQSM